MIILPSALTLLLRARLSSAPATTNPSFAFFYGDEPGAAAAVTGAERGVFNGVTNVTLVDAPSAGKNRVVRSGFIYNADSLTVEVVFELYDGATATLIQKASVPAGASLVFGDNGFVAGADSSGVEESPVTALTNSAGVVNVDLSEGDYFTLLGMTANVTSLTFTNLPASGKARTIDITLSQDATGGRTFALPASFKAIGSSDTAIQSAANAKTKIVATTLDGGTTWAYSMAKVAP